LYDLEANDYITGQIDRHMGNIFVDPVTKKVTGIDNDLAFPDYARSQVTGTPTAREKTVAGLARFLHKDTADRISKLDPEDLRKQLENQETPNGVGKLSDASIEGAVQRLKELQDGIKAENPRWWISSTRKLSTRPSTAKMLRLNRRPRTQKSTLMAWG